MKQLIRKELRENLKYAAPILVLLSLIIVVGYNSSVDRAVQILNQSWYQYEELQPLLSDAMNGMMLLTYILSGVVLGLMQIYSERPVDRWAFLVHRPATRSQIFSAKVIAGLTLYFAATLPPVLVLIFKVATPGHVAAPFEWAMTFPIIERIFCGVAFYFAAMLCALRPGRWYASKLLPGLAPAIASVFSVMPYNQNPIWVAPLLIVLAIVIGAVAVWGTFQRDGSFESQPTVAKPATFLALLVGAFSVCMILGTVCSWFGAGNSNVWTYYTVTREGEVYKVSRPVGEQIHVADLQGNVVKDQKTGEPIDEKQLNQRTALNVPIREFAEDDDESPYRRQAFFALWRIDHRVLWYWTRAGVLVGFDALTREQVGRVEATNANKTVAKFLPPHDQYNSWNPPRTLATRHAVYTIDTQSHRASALFAAPEGEQISGWSDISMNKQSTAVLTSSRMLMVETNGNRSLNFPFKAAPDERVSIYGLNNGRYLLWVAPKWQALKPQLPSKLTWIASDNKVAKTLVLPEIEQANAENPLDSVLPALMPPGFNLTAFFLPEEVRQKYFITFASKTVVVITLIIGAICAALVIWRGRKYNFSALKQIGWAIVCFLFGVPGLLAFFSVYQWPALVKCPKCGRTRVVTNETCEHCEADFPAPEKIGVEIFAPLVKSS